VACHPDGARTALKYFLLSDRHRVRTAVITVDRKWSAMRRWTRCASGLWEPRLSPAAPEAPPCEAPRKVAD
jgi:hypothetical protein